MSKILDMAKTFEQTSKQQADDIESSLKPEFERHEEAIKEALDSSRQSISDAIQDQQKRIGWLLLKSWGVMLISGLLLLAATSGTLWYQGNLIAERWLITSCRSANNIMPITFFLPAFIASSFYSA